MSRAEGTQERPNVNLEIRRITPEDFTEVGELVVESYRHDGYLTTPQGRHDEAYAAELAAAEQRDSQAEVWLAVDGDVILGCVTWCPVGSSYRELATDDSQGEFRGLAVTPQARGHGAGRALVQFCLRRAREESLRSVVLCSMPRMHIAHRLYESLGFTRRPDLDWSPVPDVPLWAFSIDL